MALLQRLCDDLLAGPAGGAEYENLLGSDDGLLWYPAAV